MLYKLYESQRTLMEPFVDFAQAAAKLYTSPLSPLGKTPLSQRVSAGYSLMYRLGKDYEKPSFDIHQVDVDKQGVSLAIHERIEVDKPFCELRRFKRFTDDSDTLTQLKDQPAVLVVAPLSGHYSTLLRDTVKTMLKDHKVYITDWKNARDVPLSEGAFHLDDYVNYVQEFIRHLQGKYGNCHVISVCQPTVPVFAAISLMASRGEKTPLSMIMMGGPIDARLCPTSVNNLATTKPYEWFENNVIYAVPGNFAGKGRRVYPGFLQHTGFVAMNPDRHATSHYDFFKNLIKGDDVSTDAHRKFYDEYNAVLDMDADYYLETIKTVFQDFKLVNSTWDVMSTEGNLERVKPGDIKTTAVMTVEGELDDISGSGQTRAALDMCSGVAAGQKVHLEAEGAGHYGIFSGRRWRDVVYPAVKSFILQHNEPLAHIGKAPVAAKKAAKPVNQPTLETPSTLKTSTTLVAAEAEKQAAKRGTKTATTTPGLKSKVAAAESPAKEIPNGAEKPPVGKPVLMAVKNTANKPEFVSKNNPTAEAQTTTMPDATVASAPDSGVKASTDTPIPPEKSAA
ncbi:MULTISPECIES: polyhydroxyalkanoate depolymerase [unclassified Polaromonas]|uniref:polyhydroxyalkanoate depolymerase n=1 Tax=unclassified Polaromonas TaxID=2638319 RepID=UPI0018CADB1B|nr:MULTISPECIES: polyhydroxyalkanoate depolymerase [unclassified Polaromonas]MBG6072092.1 poly(3-hydroxybutyrate) depolymerase [Polaromonas sp. CG_9.7]MBG6114095.1 poly(3-hydroxybutyrate) depolymerase [Polaromonas sp. CG_9.2]